MMTTMMNLKIMPKLKKVKRHPKTTKLLYNDKGEKVPKKCPKCGSDIGIFLKGEPVFLCKNKDCRKFFGVVDI